MLPIFLGYTHSVRSVRDDEEAARGPITHRIFFPSWLVWSPVPSYLPSVTGLAGYIVGYPPRPTSLSRDADRHCAVSLSASDGLMPGPVTHGQSVALREIRTQKLTR